jgi:hypothetical protein
MAWVKLEDDWYDHPKLIDLDLAVVGLWVLGITYCNRYLTDGSISKAALRRFAPTARLDQVAVLVDNGLWDRVDGGFQVHDYLDYQPSAALVKEQRKRRQEAGRLGGKRSGEARASANGQANASASARTPTRPVPTPIQSLSVTNEEALPSVENAKKARETKAMLKAVGE